jgi:hypothetical protein
VHQRRGPVVLTRRGLGAAAACALLAPPARAEQASTSTLTASADATIFANQGGGTQYDATADGAGASLWTSVIAAGVIRRALLRFDTAALPPGAQVVSVRLEAFAIRLRAAQTLSLHRLLASWGEGPANGGDAGVGAPAQAGDSTWSHRFWPSQPWAQRGGDFVASASAAVEVSGWPAPVVWPSTPQLVADVQAWVDQPASNHGWIMIGDDAGLQNAGRLASRNTTDVSSRPRLVVQWLTPLADAQVPLPPWALALFAAGAGAALLRRGPKTR